MVNDASGEKWLPVIGNVPSGWDVLQFGESLDGGTRNGIYKKKEFHGRGTKIVNMGELFGHPRLFDVEMKRVELTDKELDNSQLQVGDLLFARRSLVAEGAGKCSVVCEVNEPTTFESSIIRARPQKELLDSLFAYYLFNSPFGRHALGTIRRTVAVSGITGSDLVLLSIPLPPLSEQKAIASILGTLDDKIELNGRMNETLEATARAIFKSWFVDFDPVRAKLDGRHPPGLDPATAALFPDSFEHVDGELVPEGWHLCCLEEVLSVIETGSRPKGGVGGITTGVPSVGAESIVGIGKFNFGKTKFVSVDFFEKMRRGRVESRDVLLYKDGGRPGEYEPHVSMFGDGFPFSEFCINEHVYRLRCNKSLSQHYLYFWLTSDGALDEMRRKGTGVAIPGLNSTAVKSLATLVPSSDVVVSFDELVEPLIARLFTNCKESQSLAETRDTLLPRLLSGEIRVADAENIAEGVA